MINVRINDEPTKLTPRITVVGVGGAGGNAVNNMINSGLEGCEFLVCNTDAQALQESLADHKIQLGTGVTQGLGAGARPDVGRAAAEESLDEIINHLAGSNMVFITCGMGGGTGTGAAAVIARAARDQGILTVGVATKPFHFEGSHRMKLAESGLKDLQEYVDTLIVIPNQNLFRIANEKTTFADAFKMADDVLQAGVRGVTDLMVMPGLINLDFADVKSVMSEMGKAIMGTGESTGERRATEAAEAAISNPLLDDVSMKGARGVLINITGGLDMTLFEVDEAANRIRDEVDPDANIIFGSTFNEAMEGTMRVSIVATGIDQAQQRLNDGGYKPATNVVSNKETTVESTASNNFARATIQPQAQVNVQAQVQETEEKIAVGQNVQPNQGIMTPNGHHIPPAGTPFNSGVEQQVRETMTQVTGNEAYSTGTNIPAAKGQRIQGSFIPPQPMSVEGKTEETMAPVPVQQSAQPAPATTQTKSPTLFERLTSTVTGRNKEEEVELQKIDPSLGNPQKTLGIEESSADDELDIPAFLRRQAN